MSEHEHSESTRRPLQPLPVELAGLWAGVADVLTVFGEIQDRLDPPRIPEFADRLLKPVAELERQIQRAVDQLSAVSLPDDAPANLMIRAGTQLLQANSRMQGARRGPHEILKAFQSLLPISRAHDLLFRLAVDSASQAGYVEISAFYLTPALRDGHLLAAPAAGTRQSAVESNGASAESPRGLRHYANQRGQRGGYSLFVPESYTSDRKWPLIVALHGGSGHGANFLWSWLRDARACGCLLASATSRDRTWSLREADKDGVGLNRMLGQISERYNIDSSRLLLTGISDGGTYSMLLAAGKQSPFTHYAPVAAAVHAMQNREGRVLALVAGTRIYMVHGARDWMFAVDQARSAADALKDAGAELVYREIDDLSHSYPRDENPRILEWFLE